MLKNFLESNQTEIHFKYRGKRLNGLSGFQEIIRSQLSLFQYIKFFIKTYVLCGPIFVLVSVLGGGNFKNAIYRMFGVKIGKDVIISPFVYVDNLFPNLITIEDGVIIGLRSMILTHEFLNTRVKLGRVKIEKKSVIGANTTIMCGKKIGKGSIVGMNSLVNKDVPDLSKVAGIPAKPLI